MLRRAVSRCGNERLHARARSYSGESDFHERGAGTRECVRSPCKVCLVAGVAERRRYRTTAGNTRVNLAEGIERNRAKRTARWILGVNDVRAAFERCRCLDGVAHAD